MSGLCPAARRIRARDERRQPLGDQRVGDRPAGRPERATDLADRADSDGPFESKIDRNRDIATGIGTLDRR
ncbi:MAG: hypothetical protein ACREQ5_30540 [Candidatus Dormibacteria bacterium]